MKIVQIIAEACGYYSDATYTESLFITKETFNKLKKDIENIEICISDLDGKHSETEAEIDCHEYIEKELLENDLDFTRDGWDLYYVLESIFNENELNLDEELKKAKDYLDSLDKLETVKFTVRHSQIDIVTNFIKNL